MQPFAGLAHSVVSLRVALKLIQSSAAASGGEGSRKSSAKPRADLVDAPQIASTAVPSRVGALLLYDGVSVSRAERQYMCRATQASHTRLLLLLAWPLYSLIAALDELSCSVDWREGCAATNGPDCSLRGAPQAKANAVVEESAGERNSHGCGTRVESKESTLTSAGSEPEGSTDSGGTRRRIASETSGSAREVIRQFLVPDMRRNRVLRQEPSLPRPRDEGWAPLIDSRA